jgi:glucose repression mediator protein
MAKDAYDRVLAASPNHAKVLQQLGGLYQRQGASFFDVERSVLILTKSLEQGEASKLLQSCSF